MTLQTNKKELIRYLADKGIISQTRRSIAGQLQSYSGREDVINYLNKRGWIIGNWKADYLDEADIDFELYLIGWIEIRGRFSECKSDGFTVNQLAIEVKFFDYSGSLVYTYNQKNKNDSFSTFIKFVKGFKQKYDVKVYSGIR